MSTILSNEWGKLTIKNIDGSTVDYKDCKIWNTHSCIWDWSLTGTNHSNGIQQRDCDDFIDGVDEIILSKGVHDKLNVPQSLLDYITSKEKKSMLLILYKPLNCTTIR